MNNVTPIRATNEMLTEMTLCLEMLNEMNFYLEKTRKPKVRLIDLNHYALQTKLLEKMPYRYDLNEFFSSLTDEEVTWEKTVRVEGTVISSFCEEPPKEIWDDELALDDYMHSLDPREVNTKESDVFKDIDLFVRYAPTLVVTPAMVAKLHQTKRHQEVA